MKVDKKIKFNNIEDANKLINDLNINVNMVEVTYSVDIEKELCDIQGNIGDSLATLRNGGKDSSLKKSLKAAKERINLLLEVL